MEENVTGSIKSSHVSFMLIREIQTELWGLYSSSATSVTCSSGMSSGLPWKLCDKNHESETSRRQLAVSCSVGVAKYTRQIISEGESHQETTYSADVGTVCYNSAQQKHYADL